MAQKMESEELNIPEATNLPGTETAAPFVILADDAFPLTSSIMKPYPLRNLDTRKKKYNYRLSRARHVVESAFGLLVQRFRIFQCAIPLAPEKVERIVKASCVLHNWLNSVSSFRMSSVNDGTELSAFTAQHQNASTRAARDIREIFADFFEQDS